MKTTMHMMIGNVGSGKSEMAAHLAKRYAAVIVNMDAIQESMHGYYGGYCEALKPVYQATEESIINGALSQGVDVIIDRTNLDKKRRARFINIAKQYDSNVLAYHFPVNDSPFCPLLERRMKNPRGLTRNKWESVIKRMSESYEAPHYDEGISEIQHYWQTQIRHNFLAVDFDGTIVEHEFPKIGKPIESTINRMRDFWNTSLFNRIIIWTCRSGDYLSEMAEYLRLNNIPYDFINDNPLFDTGSRKIYATEYLDDRNVMLNK